MQESKRVTNSSSTYTKRSAGLSFSKILKIGVTEHMFCRGQCTEATCFEQLCGACVTEYYEYKESRND